MNKEFIGVGMYSINFELESAWKELFLLAGKLNPDLRLPIQFLNTVDKKDIVSNHARLSHICGFPLTSHFKEKLTPLCTPHFDLDGLEGPNYFSYYLVSKSSKIDSVEETEGLVAAINSHDSHSGYNVFRREIEVSKKLGLIDCFFKKIVVTGSHQNSIQSIIKHESDIACIDAISLSYLDRANPEIAKKLKIIGRSVTSPAPPFVTQIENPLCASNDLIQGLNIALNSLNQGFKGILKINRFSYVSLSQYESHVNR